MSEEAQLKREGTMMTTAQEGKEFLQSQGMTVTDDDVKTRGQKERLDEISNETPETTTTNGADNDGPPASLKKEGTMAVTAREGAELLGDEELGRTRGETAILNKDDDNGEVTSPSKIKRTTTMAQTAEDGQQIIGNEEFGKTRSQTQRLSESDDKKPAVKRTSTMAQTAKEGEEFLEREAKRSKDTTEETGEPNGVEEVKKVDDNDQTGPEVQMSEA